VEEAARATRAGDKAAALVALRRALELLPSRSRQHAQLTEQVRDLSREVDGAPGPTPQDGASWGKRAAGGAAVLGLLLWKLKFVLGYLFAQGKLLLLGLTKLSTLASMLLSLGVYWAAFGYRFALGLILCLYVHEM